MSLDYLVGAPPVDGKITPLIDGNAYFDEFFDEIDSLQSGDKLFLMKWHLDRLFGKRVAGTPLHAIPDENRLRTKLLLLGLRGVDVRILLWINTAPFQPFFRSEADLLINTARLQRTVIAKSGFPQLVENALAISQLRALAHHAGVPALANGIIVNTLDAPFAGCHAKFALILKKQTSGFFRGIGYTGGMDLSMTRYAEPMHRLHRDVRWHDVQARVEGGQIIGHLLQVFDDAWTESIERRAAGFRPKISIAAGAFGEDIEPFECVPQDATLLDLDDVELDTTSGDTPHWVQSLQTVPEIRPGFGEPTLQHVQAGQYAFRDALAHAIATAKTYIYIEDQAMDSLEIYDMLRAALWDTSRPNLEIILLTGQRDPDDPPGHHVDRVLVDWYFYETLLPAQKKRFHYFEATRYVVHSKVFLFDDVLAIVGSAGMITRSLTYEWEHAVAYVDKPAGGSGGGAGAPTDTSVAQFRMQLWAEALQMELSEFKPAYPTLEAALNMWRREPEDGTAPKRHACFARASTDYVSEGVVPEMLIPVIEDGTLKEYDLEPQIRDNILEDAGYFDPEHPDRTVVDETIAVVGRRYEWDKEVAFIRITGKVTNAAPGDAPLSHRTTTQPFVFTDFGDIPTAVDDAGDPIEPVVNIGFAGDTITDDRLVSTETDPLLTDDGQSVAKLVGFKSDLAKHGVLVECTGGPNIGQVRPILTHVGDTITVEPFEDDAATDFEYILLYPKIRELRLHKYRTAPQYSGNYPKLLFEASAMLLTREILFRSMFNTSEPSPVAVPVPVGRPVAVNEIVELRTLASNGTVTWSCADATPSTGTGPTFQTQFSSPGVSIVRATQQLPDRAVEFDFEVHVLIPSGPEWHTAAPPAVLDDLIEPLRTKVANFIGALEANGITPHLISTHRPRERAYLMHFSYQIAMGKDPRTVDERRAGVDISWVHYDASGDYDETASRAAAQALASTYGVYPPDDDNDSPPAYPTNHSEGKAIDMSFHITTAAVVPRGDGDGVMIVAGPRDLTELGKTYGVIRRKHNSNHWSLTGN